LLEREIVWAKIISMKVQKNLIQGILLIILVIDQIGEFKDLSEQD